MPTVVDVSRNRWFVGGLLSEIFCIMVPRLHSCCWKGYRNDNWYKRSCKPENENSQTTVWRLSKLKDFLMKSWHFLQKKMQRLQEVWMVLRWLTYWQCFSYLFFNKFHSSPWERWICRRLWSRIFFFHVLGLEIMDLFIPTCTLCPYLNEKYFSFIQKIEWLRKH